MGITVRDRPDAGRFEARRNGELVGFVEYRRSDGEIALVHTEVVPAAEHSGVGTELVRATLDIARSEGLGVLPYCPFVRTFIDRHREYLELVPADRRGGFGLPVDG